MKVDVLVKLFLFLFLVVTLFVWDDDKDDVVGISYTQENTVDVVDAVDAVDVVDAAVVR